MSAKKILFFDVDGTIVSWEGHIVPASARRALFTAEERGHLLVVNTGRPYLHVEPQIKALPFHGYICSLGGHILWKGETLFHSGLTAADCARVLTLSREHGMTLMLESEQGVYCDIERCNPHALSEFRWLESHNVPAFPYTDAPDLLFDKFVAWPLPGGEPARFSAALSDVLRIIPRENGMMEAVAKGLSKAAGMQRLLDALGLDIRDSLAFGDGPNDLDMLHAAGTGVLMGNAPQELWPEADYVTDTLSQDGLARALKHFGLI